MYIYIYTYIYIYIYIHTRNRKHYLAEPRTSMLPRAAGKTNTLGARWS